MQPIHQVITKKKINTMKFVIIQCVDAYHSELQKILKQTQINTYSEFPVDGFMRSMEDSADISNWFSASSNPYRYILSFAVIEKDKVDRLLERIQEFNAQIEGVSPINAIVANVEKYV